ncbi:MAG: response regulator [Parabacteroides johnsonii]
MANYGTIVVVDDNPAILTAVKICLAGEFDRVLTLASPDTLLTVLAQEVVDGILLDMNFTQGGNSGQDGLLWLRAIHKKHPAIPVVLVTAYADIKLAVRGLKMGAADFVAKPWDNQELIRVLKDAIDAGRKVVSIGTGRGGTCEQGGGALPRQYQPGRRIVGNYPADVVC